MNSLERLLADFHYECLGIDSDAIASDAIDTNTTDTDTDTTISNNNNNPKKKKKLSNKQRFAIVEFLDEFKIGNGPAVKRGSISRMANCYGVTRKTILNIWNRY